MIYLHTYKNNDTETTHDFFNSDDNMYYSISISNDNIRYYKVYATEDLGVTAVPVGVFKYTLPKDLCIIDINNNKSRYDDLIDSKLRIALNSI